MHVSTAKTPPLPSAAFLISTAPLKALTGPRHEAVHAFDAQRRAKKLLRGRAAQRRGPAWRTASMTRRATTPSRCAWHWEVHIAVLSVDACMWVHQPARRFHLLSCSGPMLLETKSCVREGSPCRRHTTTVPNFMRSCPCCALQHSLPCLRAGERLLVVSAMLTCRVVDVPGAPGRALLIFVLV